MYKVKICGITNLKDALSAVHAGADAIGFVFYSKSTRYINPNKAKKIIEKLPPFVQSVGLFVNETAKSINKISKISKIDIAQIHFDANIKLYNNLKVKYIKVIRAQKEQDIKLNYTKHIIIDSFVPEFGGEGKRLNLEWFRGKDCSKIILAGGLQVENLKELKDFKFYGVDVSSGVEKCKGKKDKHKMINFCNKVNELY